MLRNTLSSALILVALLAAHAWLGPGEAHAAQRVLLSYGSTLLIFVLLMAHVLPLSHRRLGPAQALVLAAPAFILVAAFGTLLLRQLADPSRPLEMHRDRKSVV